MIILQILLVAVMSSSGSAESGWNGIVPLHSTRAEVELLLGPPVKPCQGGCRYANDKRSVFVFYSGEPCEKEDQNRWRVPPNTVVGLIVHNFKKPRLSHLKLDPRKFTKTLDPELQGYFRYTNEQEGVTYEVSARGVVLSVEYFPSLKDQDIWCPEPTQKSTNSLRRSPH